MLLISIQHKLGEDKNLWKHEMFAFVYHLFMKNTHKNIFPTKERNTDAFITTDCPRKGCIVFFCRQQENNQISEGQHQC